VHESIASQFVDKLKNEFAKIKIGDGADEKNQLGPMINKAAVKKISDLIDDAKNNGAEVLYAADISDSKYSKGCYVAPTIVLNHSANTLIESSEIFRADCIGLHF
jgi:succinate-semialdehyde dehydrogenase/glutarate-semialdehyde dehydrogenase